MYYDGSNIMYTGEFKAGKREGQGNLIVNYPDNQWVYQGNWKNN